MDVESFVWELEQIEKNLDRVLPWDSIHVAYALRNGKDDLPLGPLARWFPGKGPRWPVGELVMDWSAQVPAYPTSESGVCGISLTSQNPPPFVIAFDLAEGPFLTKPTSRKPTSRLWFSAFHYEPDARELSRAEAFKREAEVARLELAVMEVLEAHAIPGKSPLGIVAGCNTLDEALLALAALRAHPLLRADCLDTKNTEKRWALGFPEGAALAFLDGDIRTATRYALATLQQMPTPARSRPQKRIPRTCRPVLAENAQRVKNVDGRWYDVTPAGMEMLKILFAAQGEWVAGKTIGANAHKTRARMPEPVAKMIESHQDNGYRIPSLLPR